MSNDDMTTKLHAHKAARTALREKILSAEVYPEIEKFWATLPAQEQGGVICALRDGDFTNGTTLDPRTEEHCIAFAKKHAPVELEAMQSTYAAFNEAYDKKSEAASAADRAGRLKAANFTAIVDQSTPTGFREV